MLGIPVEHLCVKPYFYQSFLNVKDYVALEIKCTVPLN